MTFRLLRANSAGEATKEYGNHLLDHFRNDQTLQVVPDEILRLLAEVLTIKTRPHIISDTQYFDNANKKVWEYVVQPGPWAPELSGIIGGDQNLHCGEEATLASAGLIGLYTPVVSHAVGGDLVEIMPLRFKCSVSPADKVKITLTYKSTKMGISFFKTASKIVTGPNAGRKLYDDAQLKVVGAKI